MQITAKVLEIPREKHLAPDDGVHKTSNKSGYLKGCHSFIFEMTKPFKKRLVIPKGQTGFYLAHKKEKNIGIKVFYKPEDWRRCGRKGVMREWRNRIALHAAGVAPRPYKVARVSLDLTFRGVRKKTWARGIVTQHVHYPEEVWHEYARGIPYNFNALSSEDHPLHNAEGFIAFKEKVKKALKETGVTICQGKPSLKLGDIVYCLRKKRYFLVDCA